MQQTTEHVIRVRRKEVKILVDFFGNYDSRSLWLSSPIIQHQAKQQGNTKVMRNMRSFSNVGTI